MRLAERFADRRVRPYHSTIATTFSLDFGAIEQIVLPNVLGCGCTNLALLADPRMVTMALSSGLSPPRQLGTAYALAAPVTDATLFHPKLVLQLGRDGGRLFVSSANLTTAGLAGNAEVAVEVECGPATAPELALVQAAWRYLDGLVPSGPSATRDALEWARERSPWLRLAVRGDEPTILADGTAAAFLARPGGPGIGARFAALVGPDGVELLAVVSPYWDERLEGLAHLRRVLRPERTAVLLDRGSHDFPAGAPEAASIDVIDISERLWPKRFKHAKVLLARTSSHDHLLIGSANCTMAALGDERFAGSNAEACLYRRLPRGAGAAALGLEELLGLEPIDVANLARVASEPAPLKDLADASPGVFDLEGSELAWSEIPDRWSGAGVQLLDHAMRPVEELEPERMARVGERRIGRISDPARGAALFARATLPDRVSAPAHVSRRAALRTVRREPASGSVARALAQVAGGNLDLLLQQAFEELCREDERAGETTPGAVRPPAVEASAEDRPPRILTYDEFMRSRPPGAHRPTEGPNALAGRHADTVRDLLNRLTGRRPPPGAERPVPPANDDDEEIDEALLAMPEEEAVQRGGPDREGSGDDASVNSKVDAALFHKRVRTYCDSLLSGAGPLGPGDVLRFRLWLLVVLHHARCTDLPLGLQVNGEETGWPRMLVRLLSAFFCKPRPALARLVMGVEAAGLPEDFAECWATAIWAGGVLAATLPAKGPTAGLHKMVPLLRQQMLTTLVLGPAELAASEMAERFGGLDATLGARLGLPALTPALRGGPVIAS